MGYTLTKEALLLDLYAAFSCARRHKSTKGYVRHFEKNLDENLRLLADELMSRTYKPEPSSCFIIDRPKKREVFAAQFRDRVVHHLYYNYTHKLFERTFIQDTYSCIPGRGTHYGIDRLAMHVRQESNNYSRRCHVLLLDKRGYFMHIDRKRLLDIALCSLEKMRTHNISKRCRQTWDDIIDFGFVEWLTEEIVMLDPKTHCRIVGDKKAWDDLDKNKSLFYTDEGRGLPIGNLTSQLFSNVYLNIFDQYMKRELGCKHYGRYVDDSYVVSHDKEWLLSIVPKVRQFLYIHLGLELHMGKLHIINVDYGVEFLGAYIKRYRRYMSNMSLKRALRKIRDMEVSDAASVYRSVNSYLGVMNHYASYNIKAGIFLTPKFLQVSTFNKNIMKMDKFNILN